MFMGIFGRKGAKDEELRAGKTALTISFTSGVPLVIMKNKVLRRDTETKGYRFACCIDGSKKSLETLAVAKTMATKENDEIYAITCELHGYSKPKRIYEDLVQKRAGELGITVQHLWCEEDNNNVIESLEDYVNTHELHFNFILVGNCGLGADHSKAEKSGTIAEHMIRQSLVNPVIVP